MTLTRPPLVVVTDLDGTLLDHHHYDFVAALPALERLRKHQIPVVLNTSKTRAEVQQWRAQLDNHHPYVIENGGAILWPTEQGERVQSLGKPRHAILEVLARIQTQLSLTLEGFSHWTTDELMTHTGLAQGPAEQAMARRYSEPLLWPKEQPLERFSQALAEHDLQGLRGGRFLHVQGQHDKSDALGPLREHYHHELGQAPVIVALGDGDNDRAMLAQADWAVVIRSPNYPPLQVDAKAGRKTMLPAGIGPFGWNQAIHHILDHYQFD